MDGSTKVSTPIVEEIEKVGEKEVPEASIVEVVGDKSKDGVKHIEMEVKFLEIRSVQIELIRGVSGDDGKENSHDHVVEEDIDKEFADRHLGDYSSEALGQDDIINKIGMYLGIQ